MGRPYPWGFAASKEHGGQQVQNYLPSVLSLWIYFLCWELGIYWRQWTTNYWQGKYTFGFTPYWLLLIVNHDLVIILFAVVLRDIFYNQPVRRRLFNPRSVLATTVPSIEACWQNNSIPLYFYGISRTICVHWIGWPICVRDSALSHLLSCNECAAESHCRLWRSGFYA